MIPEPSEEALALGVSDEILNFDQGVLAFKIPHWTQDKPDYTTGYYLWTSLRVRLSNGTYFYTTPVLSEEWGDYLEIGGTQLIRNSKTLIDTRIYWY